jgi:hypothetical protein
MSGIAWIRLLDGEQAILVCPGNGPVVEVRVGDEYRKMNRAEWERLPVWSPVADAADWARRAYTARQGLR